LAARQKEAAGTADAYGIDLSNSRAGRTATRLFTAGMLVNTFLPIIAVLLLSAVSVAAQTPTGGFFEADPTTAGRGIVEFIKYFRNLLFLAGLFFFGWAALNLGFERQWGMKVAGAIGCWGFATFAATVYQFSQGKAVQLDTTLGA
jgi:hypothetical protein